MTHIRRAVATAAAMALMASLLVLGAGPATAVTDLPGVISNGTISLGVFTEGYLNADGVGIRYDPTGADGIIAGCACEGWGAGDTISAVSGFANGSSGISNVVTESFVIGADTAVSTTLIPDAVDPMLRVTHDYRPSPDTPNLYEVLVTIENTSAATVSPVYERVMDWDIPPTQFDEYVTIQGTAAASAVTFASDDGFQNGDPLGAQTWINFTGDAVDNLDTVLTPGGDGPSSDHGAQFRFQFADLAPGESTQFRTFYGAAATQTEADGALAAVGAEVYSYGQPNTTDGPTLGEPNTFIFAFAGVGGSTAFPLVNFASDTYSVQEDMGPASIAVVLSAPSSNTVTVNYASSAGTASPGDDYTEVSGTLSFAPGETSRTFDVPIVDDGTAEGNETVNLALTDPDGAFLDSPDTAVLTITDPPPTTTTTTTVPTAAPAVATPAAPAFTG